MKTNSQQKGDELEDAVKHIQNLIFETNPSYKNLKFEIEPKKIIFPGGVKREIDLYVTVDPGNDMESIFIFECKNWKKPVDANSITIFSTKIKETNATKGFFIAKEYSKSAKNEAAKDKRIMLLLFDDTYIETNKFPKSIIFPDKSKDKIKIKAFQRGGANKITNTLKINNLETICFFDNRKMSLNQFAMSLRDKLINEKINKNPINNFTYGNYPCFIQEEIEYEKGKLIINNIDIEKIILNINFEIHVIKLVTVSYFDIKNKGYSLKQEFIMPNGKKMITNLITL